MASPKIELRVPEGEKASIERMAATLGFVKLDGSANVSAYLRAAHRLVKSQYEQGLIKPGTVQYENNDQLESGAG